ncbi:MAG: 4Fe-4S dicluster domain-containing protein [Halobacteriota archaeon]|nr:4Fe-4S dicluster domain-containing protein [Halobacteriota archaeon]
MQLEKKNIDALKCTGCGACELACSFYRDEVFSTIRSSVMMYREEKKNYFGIMVKVVDDLLLGRPEGVEFDSESTASNEQEGASGKPILMREECDLCKGKAYCVKLCPAESIIE